MKRDELIQRLVNQKLNTAARKPICICIARAVCFGRSSKLTPANVKR